MKFNNDQEFRADRGFYPDRDYAGFQLRVRHYYDDPHIISQTLGGGDFYRLPANPKVVLDVGAHIGLVSLLMARAGAQVYAFEPEIYNFETLSHNVEINEFGKKILSLKEAVGKSGTFKLYVDPRASGCNSFNLGNTIRLISDKYQLVPSISIREVFEKYNIKHCDLLKIDCEGSEWDIIGDVDEGLVSKIGQISMEIHGKKETWPELVNKLANWYSAEHTIRRTNNSTWVFRKERK